MDEQAFPIDISVLRVDDRHRDGLVREVCVICVICVICGICGICGICEGA